MEHNPSANAQAEAQAIAAESVVKSQDGANSTSKNEAQAPDPIKNLKGEFQRKISKLDEKMTAILNAVNARVATQSPPAEEATVDSDVRQYVDSAFTRQKQVDSWQEALSMFQELNPESEHYDQSFYDAVDAEYSSNLRKDPKGPLKAAKLVAVELGKIEALTQRKLLNDEARRSRILGEGSTQSREAKKERDPAANFNVKGLAKLGINPDKLSARMKNNKDKYEGL